MDSKKSNNISDIVRLQRILKKWKKFAKANANAPKTSSSTTNNGTRSIKFLKKTLSFSDSSSIINSSNDVVPKGFLAICVGKELKRFIIPTGYLAHQAFGILLREAEEEFGFQQEGVLKIPCQVAVFEKILKMVEEKREVFLLDDHHHDDYYYGAFSGDEINGHEYMIGYCSPDNKNCELNPSHHHDHHPQMCR